jgi:DNA polymerase I-like protein with 3'-5' exonuclease and polymerase domains
MFNSQAPSELPDLRRVGLIALDTESNDEGLRNERGPGWPWGGGYICGISLAWRADGNIRAIYIPLRHPDSLNFNCDQVTRWLHDLLASDVHIVTKNGLYDWGWLRTTLGIKMPAAERLEEIDALATMVDENRRRYSLDTLCAWRGFPGKDESLLLEGCAALGLLPENRRKKFNPQAHLWQLPARFVGPYAETDAIRTLELYESLNPILDREGTRDAYRLEIDLLPMVHMMRRRGIRTNTSAAEQTSDLLLRKRDAVLAQISDQLGANIGMDEINGRKWLISTFDRLGITYPRTEKGNPSFKRGKRGWMQHSSHWLPPLIAAADQLDQYGDNFLQTQILGHVENGRVYGEIHPHRSDFGGTCSFRFSYSHPPLQQMPKHDEELAPLIRGVFLPEEGETWASCDYSQQEFRLVVHFASRKNFRGAIAARDRYIKEPDFDIHAYASELTGGKISRQDGKTFNFMTIYGAGPETTSKQVKKSLAETKALLALYNEKMPFISQLATACKNAAHRGGHFTLFNGARRHFNQWAPGGKLEKGAGPCEHGEAERRTHDPGHPWYGKQLWRAETYKALNVLIQSAAAIQTKEWMRACFREGVVPLLSDA